MSHLSRFARASVLAASFLLFSASSMVAAAPPWEAQTPFSSDPATLLAAATNIDAGEHPYIVLLDEGRYRFESDGSSTTIQRMIYRVVDESAVEYMASIEANWSPWYSQRPKLEARVITKGGTVHTLDQSAVTESPAGDESSDVFSDSRIVRAPLPAVAVGSVVEYVITIDGRSPIEGAGLSSHFTFGMGVPVQRTRVIVDVPAALAPRIVNRTGTKETVEERDGRRVMRWEAGPTEAIEHWEDSLPPEELGQPYIAFSTGTSWKDIATRYAEIVDRQIAGSSLEKAVRAAIGNATEPREIAARLLAAIQKDIRYAGVEIGEGSIIPRPPKTVLQNKYGDCKDKATLLVAMLREAGLTAHVALVRSGYDYDASNELPGLGMFNHAIVRIENGDAPIWVDPTDVFSRAGELPMQDQGRMALVASSTTTELVRTPEAPASANLYREVRTFTLPESGNAKVTEVSEYRGHAEVGLRRQFATQEPKTLRENLDEYVKSAYVAKGLERHDNNDPRDLTKPFRLTLEVNESESGIVADGEGDVAINRAAMLDLLPSSLRDREEATAEDEPQEPEEKRKHDFYFSTPTLREWTYRIVPPTGYLPRTLPPADTKKLGTVTYSEAFSVDESGAITATLRLDSGKRRLTPAEYEETRLAVSKFAQSPTLHLGFDSIARTKMNAGDIGGALAEHRRLAQLHPKEAQHHIDMARALVAAGFGEAAREAARRAVAIEPNNADAHRALGYVLQHDFLGRVFRRGFDLPGAVAALKKAAELQPKKVLHRFEYVQILEYGEDGQRFGKNAPLKEAEEAMHALVRDFEAEADSYEPELTLIYAHTGQYEKMRELAKRLTDETQRDVAAIMATLLIEGFPAAQRELGRFDAATRRSYADMIGTTLMQMRRYPELALMMEESVQGTANASSMRPLIDMLRKAKRLDSATIEPKPENVLLQMMQAAVQRDADTLRRLFPKEWTDKTMAAGRKSNILEEFEIPEGSTDGIPFTAALDLAAAMMQWRSEGDDAVGHRVRMTMNMNKSSEATTMLVDREDGRYVIAAMDHETEYAGVSILRMAERGELDRARTWLNWLRDEAKVASADDPLAGDPLAALWPKGKSSATADEIRLAAASIINDKIFLDVAEPVLVAAREKASDAVKAQIDLALATLYEDASAWPKTIAATERLFASHPDSPTAFQRHTLALTRGGRRAEAEQLARQRLERLPDDVDALRALRASAATARDYETAQSLASKLVDLLRPTDTDYRDAAWYALFTGQKLDQALEHAERGSEGVAERKPKATALRTLAAVLAESGKSVEARQTLLKALDTSMKNDPTPLDWYVVGRIAENYGLPDAAISAYKRVGKESGGATTSELAERRLAQLTKK